MSDTFSVQGSGTESLGFDFCVRVQDTHAPELPVPAETAEYFTGAPCPLMPALILHGALQEELSGDVCVCLCVCAPCPHTCVCVGCVLMSCIFCENYSRVMSDAVLFFHLTRKPTTGILRVKSQKCGLVFSAQFLCCSLVQIHSPHNHDCTFHPSVSKMLRHVVDTVIRNMLNLEIILQRLQLHLVLTPVLGDPITSGQHENTGGIQCGLSPIRRWTGFANGHIFCMQILFIYTYIKSVTSDARYLMRLWRAHNLNVTKFMQVFPFRIKDYHV